jgi:hypothetical protein
MGFWKISEKFASPFKTPNGRWCIFVSLQNAKTKEQQMRGYETHKGYDVRLVFDAASGAFCWQHVPQQAPATPAPIQPQQSGE